VYDADAGAELTLTELEVPGSTLVSINTEFGSFDSNTPGNGGVSDVSTRTITLPVAPGVTIVYFKNLYEGIPDEGCSLTPGYWQTHSEYGPAPYDATWAMLADGADTEFFTTGKSWYQTFHTSPRGNAYYQLSFHYMAAVLNGLNGANTSVVSSEMAAAKALFETYSPRQIASLRGKNALRRQFIALAGVLASYNEGDIGPGHCD
jgi:hypothetical protein